MLCCKKTALRSNPEAQALIWDCFSRAQLFICLLNFSTAVLQYANMEAGCTRAKGHEILWNTTMDRIQTEDEADAAEIECTGTVFGGLRPSSVLSTMASVANISIALMLPLTGSLIDHTPHRKKVVVWTLIGLWVGNFFQIFTNTSTWEIMVLVQAIICSVSYMTHQTVILSYVTEVVSDMNDQLKEINMLLRVAEMSTMLVFLIGVGVVSIVLNLDALDQAVLGQAVACVGSIAPFYVVVKQLGERPAKRQIPDGSNLYSAGLANLKKTFAQVKNENPQLFKLLIAIMFIEGANSNIVNSCVTLITQELKIENPTPIILLILFVTVPGSMSAPHLQRKLGVKGAFLLIILVNVFSTLFLMFFCYSPETANRVFVAALFFGVGIGSTYPIQRTLFYKLSPFGQENEMMGIFQACSMIIQFLPALAFTGINQLLGSVRWAMGSLVLFWSIGWGFVYMIDFEKGVADAEKTAHLKYNNSGGSTSAKVGSAIADAFRNGSMRAK